MRTETNISLPSKLFRGNNLDIDVQINIDLEDYKIHAELFDRFGNSIELATENNGGSDDEIEIVDEEDGTFILHFEKDLTTLFHLNSYLEITLIDDNDKEQTIYFGLIQFIDNIYLRA